MRILAIDPGCEQSAFVIYETALGMSSCPVLGHGIRPNADILDLIWNDTYEAMIVEMVASYGMSVGREVFETVYWIGRFCQARHDDNTHRIYRRDVKMTLCGNNAAKDANIRASLIDRFGPGKEKAIGVKATPGPLYGISKDEWSALAVAVTWAEMNDLVPA